MLFKNRRKKRSTSQWLVIVRLFFIKFHVFLEVHFQSEVWRVSELTLSVIPVHLFHSPAVNYSSVHLCSEWRDCCVID